MIVYYRNELTNEEIQEGMIQFLRSGLLQSYIDSCDDKDLANYININERGINFLLDFYVCNTRKDHPAGSFIFLETDIVEGGTLGAPTIDQNPIKKTERTIYNEDYIKYNGNLIEELTNNLNKGMEDLDTRR